MQTECILIVEADIVVRHHLAEYLRDCGYTVFDVATYEEARAVIGGALRHIDIILGDARAADQRSFSFTVWIRRNHPEIDVLLSGNVARATQHAGELCEEGPRPPSAALDHRALLDRIRQTLAMRNRQIKD